MFFGIRLSGRTKRILILAAAAALCAVVFALRLKSLTRPYPALTAASDALTGIGVLFLACGLALFALRRGALLGSSYLWRRELKKKDEAARKGVAEPEDKRESLHRLFLICGGVMLALGLLLLIPIYLIPA